MKGDAGKPTASPVLSAVRVVWRIRLRWLRGRWEQEAVAGPSESLWVWRFGRVERPLGDTRRGRGVWSEILDAGICRDRVGSVVGQCEPGSHLTASAALWLHQDFPSASGPRPAGPHNPFWMCPALPPGDSYRGLLSFAVTSPAPSLSP